MTYNIIIYWETTVFRYNVIHACMLIVLCACHFLLYIYSFAFYNMHKNTW